MTTDEIAILLAQKEEIDRRNEQALNMGSYERWVANALEALLRSVAVRVAATEQTTKP